MDTTQEKISDLEHGSAQIIHSEAQRKGEKLSLGDMWNILKLSKIWYKGPKSKYSENTAEKYMKKILTKNIPTFGQKQETQEV